MSSYLDTIGSIRPTAPEQPGTFSRAVDRGADQMQGSLYAVTNALGRLTGIDAVEAWGEEGVQRNMEQIAANPPEIHSWDDVDGLATFGTYFLEALGEQVPQLGADLVAGAIGGGIAGVAARRAALTVGQKAAIGKGLKRQVGEKAYGAFRARVKGRSPVDMGAAAGVLASNFAQNSGETQMGFMADGIDAPGTALMAGAVKGALDTIAPLQALAIAKRAGVPTKDLPSSLPASVPTPVSLPLQSR
ncbi:hypothetical protein [Kineobactrum salinum]|uniref:Uncharacterized protein n=1 Tax=Kineobactrum salinum TaxID=2708301 RepID=A0A6C0U5R3_9GAMM|nr:hypothetical protein [Kineobactrum salinum]QIB67173.1 hypothetical protein G3T16_18955 [Kineobactrum salinum]